MARKFLRVKCNECGNQQIIFSRAATKINCMVCNEAIAVPTGGKPELNAEITEQLEVE